MCEDFERMFDASFPTCVFFKYFFFKVEISSCTLIPIFRPGSVHSGSATWDNCDQVFLDKLGVSSFLIGSHTMPGQWHSQPNQHRWVKGVCVFRCNLSPALLAEWLGSFMCHCGNTGVERTRTKSRHTKLILEKKILPLLLLGLELATFWSRVWRSNQQALPASSYVILYCLK